MMRHCVMAAKGADSPHDVAELTLMTIAEYRRTAPVNAPGPCQINCESDAREIAHFLTTHLPAETLALLQKKLANSIQRPHGRERELQEVLNDAQGN